MGGNGEARVTNVRLQGRACSARCTSPYLELEILFSANHHPLPTTCQSLLFNSRLNIIRAGVRAAKERSESSGDVHERHLISPHPQLTEASAICRTSGTFG